MERQENLNEIKLGEKKFHSESSLQQFQMDEVNVQPKDSNDDPEDTYGSLSRLPIQIKIEAPGSTSPNDNSRLYNFPANMPRSGTSRRRSEATMDERSLHSIETQAPPPTNPKENKKLTRKYLTLTASCMYATILVTSGLIIHIGDSFIEMDPSVYFSLILCIIGFIYHIYLMIDIIRYKRITQKNRKIKAQYSETRTEYDSNQEDVLDIGSPSDRLQGFPVPQMMPITHDYCFSQGRHSGSFYLKLGAAAFAIGHLIHSTLLLCAQLELLLDANIDDDCVNRFQVAFDVIYPCYCFVQLVFIFKYSNVIILKAQGLGHFAFMHIIGSSLCFWVSGIVRETLLAIMIYVNSLYEKNGDDFSLDDYFGHRGFTAFLNLQDLSNINCTSKSALSVIYDKFSPYLYPFNVEFNILIVAVYYIIWTNIGNCHNEDNNFDTLSDVDNYTICNIPTANEENDYTSNIVIHADCHASNRGLFTGIITMVIIAAMLILGFVFGSVGDIYFKIGYWLNDITQLGLHVIMLFAVVIAYNQLRKLDINEHPISLLDDVLLFICLPAFFMETILSLVATMSILNVIKTINFVVMVIQVLIQTPLIMDGLRRCSNSKKLRRKKPGREVLMYLIIANVGMWIFYTFSYKSPQSLDERYCYYGKILWSILGHVSLPLIMFYRFHSSVCFADIWDSAYKPGSEH